MFLLSIFLHMSTSDLLTGSVLEYWQVHGDRSLYLASLAWTGLLFRAEIVRVFTCYISLQCSFNIYLLSMFVFKRTHLGCQFLPTGQSCRFRHSPHRGPTGRQTLNDWVDCLSFYFLTSCPKPTNSQLISVHLRQARRLYSLHKMEILSVRSTCPLGAKLRVTAWSAQVPYNPWSNQAWRWSWGNRHLGKSRQR